MQEPSNIKWTFEKRKIDDLIEYDNNPRYITEHDAQHLKQSIAKFGLIDKPIVTLQNKILGGHQRINLLKEMGYDHVMCWVPNRELSFDEEAELNLRLNRNQGSFDFDILANVYNEDDLKEWGFTDHEIPSIEEKEGIDIINSDEPASCPTCGRKLKLKK